MNAHLYLNDEHRKGERPSSESVLEDEQPSSSEAGIISTLTLSVVHLDHSIRQIDTSIVDTVEGVLNQFSCNTPLEAQKRLRFPQCTKSAPKSLTQKVEKSIMRYQRDQDRWTSFTSLLMKSLAFYRSLDPAFASAPRTIEDGPIYDPLMARIRKLERKLPVVDLPRTKHNRPYLPQLVSGDGKSASGKSGYTRQTTDDLRQNHEENCDAMMNVSHQYPWVCMAQQQLGPSKEKPDNSRLLGLDLVVFEAKLSSFSPTITAFLKAFERCCTAWEWERINKHQLTLSGGKMLQRRGDESKLREFYLRWSMKEAYTKALGLGMHINFDEFETRLYGVDFDAADVNTPDGQEEGIWTSIMTQEVTRDTLQAANGQCQFSTIGKVKRKTSWEFWEFTFIPLGNDSRFERSQSECGRQVLHNSFPPPRRQNTVDNTNSPRDTISYHNSSDGLYYSACACICKGPVGQNALVDKNTIPAAIETLTLVDLIQLHGTTIAEDTAAVEQEAKAGEDQVKQRAEADEKQQQQENIEDTQQQPSVPEVTLTLPATAKLVTAEGGGEENGTLGHEELDAQSGETNGADDNKVVTEKQLPEDEAKLPNIDMEKKIDGSALAEQTSDETVKSPPPRRGFLEGLRSLSRRSQEITSSSRRSIFTSLRSLSHRLSRKNMQSPPP